MRVEFFGVPRERARTPVLEVRANTLGQMLSTLAVQVPSLCSPDRREHLQPGFVANLNGDRFVSDPATPLGEQDCVLILSADAGG